MPDCQSPNCIHTRECPISGGPCPGECVFAEVMRSANLGILVFDVAGERLLFANTAAREILEGAGQPIAYGPARAAFAAEPADSQASYPRAGDRRIGSRLVGFTVYSNDPIEWVFCRDISDKARLEAVAEVVELTNSLGHVFAAVRHELGNPINSAKMALSVLRRSFDEMPRATQLDYLDSTLNELERVAELLSTLKSYSFYEEVAPQAVLVDSFLEDFVTFARRDYGASGIVLELRAGAAGVAAEIDPRALRQVLINLMANSADAMSGQRDARVRISTSTTDRFVNLEMEDNGPGIPDHLRSHLFEPFFTTKRGGTGLGLVIARKMLARMGATITIDSGSNGGTTVSATLLRTPP